MTSKHRANGLAAPTPTSRPFSHSRNRHYWQRLNLFPYPPLSFASPARTN
ncbi:hypothetical protein KCP70_15380 [Salmonella enterica subsp. enterica]|nr:hypothetical protein KCP70_15380 [Salmonella enterica subsp. enterica]